MSVANFWARSKRKIRSWFSVLKNGGWDPNDAAAKAWRIAHDQENILNDRRATFDERVEQQRLMPVISIQALLCGHFSRKIQH